MRKGGGWVWVTSVTLIDWAIMEYYEGRMKERRSKVLAQLSDAELQKRLDELNKGASEAPPA